MDKDAASSVLRFSVVCYHLIVTSKIILGSKNIERNYLLIIKYWITKHSSGEFRLKFRLKKLYHISKDYSELTEH